MNIDDFASSAKAAAALLRALSNDRRLMILCQLSTGEKTVGTLEPLVGLRQSALSQHLAKLRREGLVGTRRDGQHIYYRLVSPEALQVIETLAGLYCPLPDRQGAQEGEVIPLNGTVSNS
ncbi:ArsR/SmtB family transcription factor [Caenispirillum salinarum]|uniref:ArsR/SmtB family transcription factor n=1 Tax=Caenispirillum salinarum TaxID=859058 RepID=UPI00384F860D